MFNCISVIKRHWNRIKICCSTVSYFGQIKMFVCEKIDQKEKKYFLESLERQPLLFAKSSFKKISSLSRWCVKDLEWTFVMILSHIWPLQKLAGFLFDCENWLDHNNKLSLLKSLIHTSGLMFLSLYHSFLRLNSLSPTSQLSQL